MDIDKNFFGRQEVLGLLKKRVLDLKDGYRQNVAFIGPEHIGKTSLLQKFIHDLDDKDLIVVYVNFKGKDFPYLATNFITSLLYNFAKSENLALHHDLALLLETTQHRLPQTFAAIKQVQALSEKKRFVEAYEHLVSLPEIFTLETNKFCVILFDEFHYLDHLDIDEAFQELGKRIMTQKRCLYFMASSLQEVARKILTEKLSLLFGHFEIVDVEPFSMKTSKEFMESHLKDFQIKDQLKNFLVDFTGGHPLYLNILISQLNQLCQLHRQAEIFLPFLSYAVENTIFNRWGVLSRHFEILVESLSWPKDDEATLRLLIALAEQKNSLDEIVCVHERRKKIIIKQKLSHLIELGLVERSGRFYYLKDKLFRYWIKYILKRRLNFVGFDPQQERILFREEFAHNVNAFHLASQKDLSVRVIELLSCFNDETFHVHGRRYRLSSFEKFKSTRMAMSPTAEMDVIKAYAPDGPWIVMLHDKDLSENDMNALLDEIKKVEGKPRKQVIISLRDLGNPLRLRALQERMWIWDEKELNFLLNMYNKPYIAL